jgi:hypothetical protein
MKCIFIFSLILIGTQSLGQSRININLKKQLDSIIVLDQKYRGLLMQMSDSVKKDSIANVIGVSKEKVEMELWNLQRKLDSLNLLFIETIFKKYGYPGKSLVDTPTNEVAWYVIQHSEKIPQYFETIKKAGTKGELPFTLVAMMEDRYLMNQHKEQIYGTQVTCRQTKTGINECFVWPIKDAKDVNERRTKAGFKSTVEENAKNLGVEYKMIHLSDLADDFPNIDAVKNKIVLIVRVYDNQQPLGDVNIYAGNNKLLGKTNEKGFCRMVIDKSFNSWALIFRKKGYNSTAWVLDGDHNVFQINIGMQKN